MFLLIEDSNDNAFINIENIAEVQYNSKTKILYIYYIKEGKEASQFEGNNALKIYNYLKSKALIL